MIWFDSSKLRPGLIFHGRGQTMYAKAIREVLGRGLPPGQECWGNHDGIFVHDPIARTIAVAECVPMKAKITPLAKHEHKINAGEYDVRVYEVVGASRSDEIAASVWFKSNVVGTWYDFWGIACLGWQYALGKVGRRRVGWEWGNWCTEGVAKAYREATALDPWKKANPTPYTTEKRVQQGVLRDITEDVLVVK